MRIENVARAVIAACLGLATCGCVYIPPVGEQVRQEDTLFVKPGVTTRDEVLQRLGPPNILDGSRVSVYQWQTTPGWIIALAPNPIVPTPRSQSRLLLEFDAAGKVSHFAFGERPAALSDPNPPRFFVDGSPQEIQGPATRPQRPDRLLPACSTRCFAVAVARDGRQVAVALQEGKVQVWDLKTGKGRVLESRVERKSAGSNPLGRAIDISADGRLLAAAAISDSTVLWDLVRGEQLHVLRGHGESTLATLAGPIAVAFAPGGKFVATGGRDGAVKLWDVASGKEQSSLQISDAQVRSMAFAPEGDLLAVGTLRGDVVVVGLKSGKRLRVALGSDALASGRSVAFSPTGETLAANSCVDVALWDVGEIRQEIERLGTAGELVAQKPRDPKAVILLPYGKGPSDSCRPSVALSAGARVLGATSTSALQSLWDLTSRRLIAIVDTGGKLDLETLTLGPGDAVLVQAVFGFTGGIRIKDLGPVIRESAGREGPASPQREAR